MIIRLTSDSDHSPASEPGLDLFRFRFWFLNVPTLNIIRHDGVRYGGWTTSVRGLAFAHGSAHGDRMNAIIDRSSFQS
ncbi:hypothetical protein EVAR_48351_1 [Eumeta japonica]|uniref:Uncharacterized protein n=1 Tax=Eumeta variegata TaxID=151549 RepID=A0A4C1WIL6_EUMVA|nr:hypothetical protein EVAR_48351_1 [Eumeta japonica]